MKTQFLSLITLLVLSTPTWANSIPEVPAPKELVDINSEFAEGTITKLSEKDASLFIPWAQNAQSVLTKALRDIESMPVDQQLRHLTAVVKSVVRNSSKKNYQMFMRFALNRSLLLKQEFLKEADLRVPGTIENALDIQIKGVELALSFYESDLAYQQRAAQGDSSINLEYAQFTSKFSNKMFDAINSIFDASAQYRLLYKTLEMVNWDLSRDPNAINYADMIVENYNTLNILNENPTGADRENIANIRKLNVLVGPIAELCEDCDAEENATKKGFTLVSSAEEIYKDNKSGLLWSDRLSEEMNHADATSACKNLAILGKSWRLPTENEFEAAEENGIRSAVPRMDYVFWSSSVHQSYAYSAWLFYGSNGDVGNDLRRYSYSVRCVAR